MNDTKNHYPENNRFLLVQRYFARRRIFVTLVTLAYLPPFTGKKLITQHTDIHLNTL